MRSTCEMVRCDGESIHVVDSCISGPNVQQYYLSFEDFRRESATSFPRIRPDLPWRDPLQSGVKIEGL